MIGDPFLNYFALFLLLFVVVVLFYGVIAVHDIPHTIAKARNHPHEDAIYAAGWVSLFTLHVLWPFLWIWAMTYRPERGWGFSNRTPALAEANSMPPMEEFQRRLSELERRLDAGEAGIGEGSAAVRPEMAKPEPARKSAGGR
jgi:hypothetical protein